MTRREFRRHCFPRRKHTRNLDYHVKINTIGLLHILELTSSVNFIHIKINSMHIHKIWIESLLSHRPLYITNYRRQIPKSAVVFYHTDPDPL